MCRACVRSCVDLWFNARICVFLYTHIAVYADAAICARRCRDARALDIAVCACKVIWIYCEVSFVLSSARKWPHQFRENPARACDEHWAPANDMCVAVRNGGGDAVCWARIMENRRSCRTIVVLSRWSRDLWCWCPSRQRARVIVLLYMPSEWNTLCGLWVEAHVYMLCVHIIFLGYW